jgi:hypothetical protein
VEFARGIGRRLVPPVTQFISEVLLALLDGVPIGMFLVEDRDDGLRLLWQVTEGGPADGSLDSMPEWGMSPASA